MISATHSDKEHIVSILTASFADNPSVNYIIKQGADKQERVRKLMEYCFENCFHSGAVYLSDDKYGCALMLYPDKKQFGFRSLIRDIKFIIAVTGIGNLKKVLSRETQIRQGHPESAFTHLWYIGVDPTHQHKGIGSTLLSEIIKESNKQNRDIYLETSVSSNVEWYNKYAFSIYKELRFATTLFLLKRLSDQ